MIFIYESRPLTEYGAKKIDEVLHRQKACLLDVKTGGGKTYMSIHSIGLIAKKARKPINLLIFTTKQQIKSHHWENSVKDYCVVTKAQLNSFVTNYEQLTSEKGLKKIFNWVTNTSKKSTIIICDEGHLVKNPTSHRSKYVLKFAKLPNVSRIMFLTATPNSNSLLDTMTYLIAAGFYKNKTQFIREHVKEKDKYHQPIVKDKFTGEVDIHFFKNPELVLNRLAQITVQIDTQSLLPEVKLTQKKFKFDKPTQKEYRQIKYQLKRGEIESAPKAIAMQFRFVADHQQQQMKYIKKVIDSKTRPQTPILIFYQWQAEFDNLYEFLRKYEPDYHIRMINSKSKKNENPSAKPKSNKTIVLAQYQSGGAGLNTPWSNIAIFLSPANTAENFEQARGRNVRALQPGPVYQIRLMMENTISQHVWEFIIDQKKRFSTKIDKELMNFKD